MKGSDENGIKRGPWMPEEDRILVDYIHKHGLGRWSSVPTSAGLNRSGKSCRLRWTNYLRPDIKRGNFSVEEEHAIINLHALLGNKWAAIAKHLPGRTDNEIKNVWNTRLKRKLLQTGIDPVTHRTNNDLNNILARLPLLLPAAAANFGLDVNALMLQSDAAAKLDKVHHLLHNLLQLLHTPAATAENRQIRINSLEDDAGDLPVLLQSNFINNLDTSQHHQSHLSEYLQPMIDSSNNGNSNISDPFTSLPAANIPTSATTPQLPPPLVSGSAQRPTGTTIVSHVYELSTTFDEASDSYWRDIVDQVS